MDIARGYVMALMVFMQNMHVFNCRSELYSIKTIKPFSNWLLPISVGGATFLQILIMEVPFLSHIMKTESIPVLHLLILLLISVPIIAIMELYKWIKRRQLRSDIEYE